MGPSWGSGTRGRGPSSAWSSATERSVIDSHTRAQDHAGHEWMWGDPLRGIAAEKGTSEASAHGRRRARHASIHWVGQRSLREDLGQLTLNRAHPKRREPQ
jgi:hypothetical protein